MIELIKGQLPYDMYFTFAVQEEVGLRGAKTAAFTVEPDFALVLEATTAADILDVPLSKQVCNVGYGTVVSFMDRSTIYDKEMYSLAFDCAKEIGCKIQKHISEVRDRHITSWSPNLVTSYNKSIWMNSIKYLF